MHHRKHRGKGFLGDAWNWVKDKFKKGAVGNIAKAIGDISGHKGIADFGNKVQDIGSKVVHGAESVGLGRRRKVGRPKKKRVSRV